MRTRWITITAFAIAAAVLVVGVAHNVGQRRDASTPQPTVATATDLPALPPAPLSVSLTSFAGEGRAVVGSSPLFAVNAVGADIREINLYDGSTLVGRHSFTSPVAPTASATFSWPAVRAGRHVLHATAIGATDDEVAHSSPVRIEVVAGLFPVDTQRIPSNGLSVSEVATVLGIDPSTAAVFGSPTADAPQGAPVVVSDLDEALPADAGVVVPVADIAAEPSPTTPPSSPSADIPVIAASLDGCAATIATADDRELAVYETAGSGPGFTQLGTVASDAPFTTGELTPGIHVFVAGAPGEPASSAPVSVTAGSDCLADMWSGPATLFDGVLTLESAVPQVWMYVGVDGKPFQRVPAVGTVPATTGSADLGRLIPSLAGETVRLEVWRPAATSAEPATLVARSEATVPESEALTDLLGESAEVHLLGVDAQGVVSSAAQSLSVTDLELGLQWNATSERVDSVLWQVLTQPLGGDDRNASPPMMIATGVGGETDLPGVSISDLPKGGFSVPAEALTAGRTADQGQPSFGLLTAPSFSSISSIPQDGVIAATAIDIGSLASDTAPAPVPMPGNQVWIRALPLSAGQIIGPPSNLIPVALFDPDEEVPVVFDVDSATFDPGHGANHALDGCVRVTQVPWELDSTGRPTVELGFSVAAFYPTVGTYCPGDWDPPPCTGSCAFFDAIVSGLNGVVSVLSAAWDVVAAAYNGIVTLAIEIAAQLNPYCLQARVAGALVEWAADETGIDDAGLGDIATEAADICTSVARVATRAVVSAVMVAVGLPPTLPTSDQLVAIAQGDLTVLAVQYLESLGVPCDAMTLSPAEAELVAGGLEAAGGETPAGIEPSNGVDVCSAMIGGVIGEVRKTVSTALQNQIASSTGLPMPTTYEPGFEAILEPRAHYSGATVTIEATPNTQPPPGFTCRFSASATAGERTTGSFEYRESLYLRLGSGDVRFRFDVEEFTGSYTGTVHLREGSELYEGNVLNPSVTADKRCLPTIPNLGSRHVVKAPLGRWKPGESD